MILCDTNVISELWKAKPQPNVLRWIDAQLVETLYLSTISVAELRFGLAVMPAGRRRTTFQDRLENEVLPAFGDRVLAFDLKASRAYGERLAQARAVGKAIGAADGYIAAIAASAGLIVASRDTSPFRAAGVQVIDPWVAENGPS